MSKKIQRRQALLERFSEFYQEIVRIKTAIRERRLALYLSNGNDAQTVNGNDLAAMVHHRLLGILQEQRRQVTEQGTKAEEGVYQIAQYLMAAHADELFIIELDWPGRSAWAQFLLERSLFRTATAGRDFFTRLDLLLKSRSRDPLQDELGTVFLMVLQLGFQGQYRGSKRQSILRAYRSKLLQFVGSSGRYAGGAPAFSQAYQYRLMEVRGQRLAPLRPWYNLGIILLLLYVLVSSGVWLISIQRLNTLFVGS